MFYKIDPTRREMAFDLRPDGFLAGDRISVVLRGDFMPTPSGSQAVDSFKNISFEIGSRDFDAPVPTTVTARRSPLVAVNHDRPLRDNSDPDDDYGVSVRLVAFTGGDDLFRFRDRSALPTVKGSIYRAGAGDDVVVMPHEAVAGFDVGRMFQAGAGDDLVRAGELGLKLDFGRGDDTLDLGDAVLGWGNKENRDRDGLVVLRSGDARYQVTDAEILKDGADQDPLLKWYFKVTRERDGDCTIVFYENGARVARAEGVYDATVAIAGDAYQAFFMRPDGRGSEQIELIDVSGAGNVSIRAGGGGNPRSDFVITADFIDRVFDHVRDAYDLAGTDLPWRKGQFTPLVPVTVEVGGATARAAAMADAGDWDARNGAGDDLIG